MIAWACGGAIALMGALTFAELAGLYPNTGGQYEVLRDAYGSLPAFLFVFCNATALFVLRRSRPVARRERSRSCFPMGRRDDSIRAMKDIRRTLRTFDDDSPAYTHRPDAPRRDCGVGRKRRL